ncbi:hypothetical protein [Variovorax boronicumulans]|uniref:hypothetical protein n=1 Tax=Variovorax boronicumulans TaxID=436515 RepID=UPI0012E6627A|nr:hypothetical protein [Variovorax boronicumulans]GER21065.1 hypothetical protein VCH24_61090 [Variovorax boronicumulans]
MSAIFNFTSPEVRESDFRELQQILPAAAAATAAEVGIEGVIAFFDGYKDSVDLQKQAA